MLKRFRDFLSARQPIPAREFTLDEIPGIIAEEEHSWNEDLKKRMNQPREKFSEVSSVLFTRVSTLTRSEAGSGYHPKLEKITRNSLPQFGKAIATALARQAPQEPSAFYQMATETLRGCVKAMAGPGRYLGTAFPDQMKEIRTLIDELGHQVNEMTPLIAEDKKRRRSFSRVRESFGSIREKQAALAEERERLLTLETREKELARKQETLARDKEICDHQVRTDRALQDAIRDQEILSVRVTEIGREIQVMTSTLAHVFSKAEKIMQKRGGGEKEIKKGIDLMTMERGNLKEGTVEQVRSVLPLVMSMINTGEIQVKNQEETNLFSNPDKICPALISLISRRKEYERDLGEKKEFIRSHPAKNRAGQLEEVLKEISNEREKIGIELMEIREGIEVKEKEIPESIHDLEEALREIFTGDIRLKV